jgi:hypothetical protein
LIILIGSFRNQGKKMMMMMMMTVPDLRSGGDGGQKQVSYTTKRTQNTKNVLCVGDSPGR